MDFTSPKTLVLKNIIKVTATADKVWNTGLASAAGAEAVITDTLKMLPIVAHNQVSVSIYENKGEEVVLNASENTIVLPKYAQNTYYKAALPGGTYEQVSDEAAPSNWGTNGVYFADSEGKVPVVFTTIGDGEELEVTASSTEAVAFYEGQAKEDILSVTVKG